MCQLEHDIEVVRILESHIGNDREYEFIGQNDPLALIFEIFSNRALFRK